MKKVLIIFLRFYCKDEFLVIIVVLVSSVMFKVPRFNGSEQSIQLCGHLARERCSLLARGR